MTQALIELEVSQQTGAGAAGAEANPLLHEELHWLEGCRTDRAVY